MIVLRINFFLEARAGSERTRAEVERLLITAANTMVKAWNTTNQVRFEAKRFQNIAHL
jgi:hypothetical protein